jgi:DNA (cytosine-5)-methyltransferase 1
LVPVIDLFAGPGGLGEGFSAFRSDSGGKFDVRLSVEKDPVACATLLLRKFLRQFDEPPAEFLAYVSGQIPVSELFAAFPAEARRARNGVWEAELGAVTRQSVRRRVRTVLDQTTNWVLLGGPPCQAYSIAGRSRMRTTRPDFERDERHFLYREYLQIVADHQPAVFVLENVKGLLTSRHGGNKIVTRILDDLSSPGQALGIARGASLRYRLYPLGQRQATLPWIEDPLDGEEFLLQAEEYGIPQMRHRIFIVGVRSDLPGRPEALERQPAVAAGEVLSDLPRIRSRLTGKKDSREAWMAAIRGILACDWMSAPRTSALGAVGLQLRREVKTLSSTAFDTGAAFVNHGGSPQALGTWFRHGALGLTHHESRAHMREDLHRYLFAATFAQLHHRSPDLRDFPKELYPAHRNVSLALQGKMFTDRFRVQLDDRPSTTITSHISKDGHYYIHYDPHQCRSLTVREAARLQTFPDDYFFEGNRTEQYHQIGNAVPPLLAMEIARVIDQLLLPHRERSTTRTFAFGEQSSLNHVQQHRR